MSLSVKVTISGDKELRRKLIKLGPALTNFTEAMRETGIELASFYSGQVFASQGGALDSKWSALKLKTRVYKSKHYPGRGPLIRTGALDASFEYDANSSQVVIFNQVKYGKSDYFPYLQLGTRNMAARPMIGVNNSVRTIIRDIIQKDIQAKLDRAGM